MLRQVIRGLRVQVPLPAPYTACAGRDSFAARTAFSPASSGAVVRPAGGAGRPVSGPDAGLVRAPFDVVDERGEDTRLPRIPFLHRPRAHPDERQEIGDLQHA